jgi:hypothetical protein
MKTFFLVNSKAKVDLLDQSLNLLFGSAEDFNKRIQQTYPNIIKKGEGSLLVKTNDSTILKFQFENDTGVIEKFVVVDVEGTDKPFMEVTKLCRENNWLLFDTDGESYVNIKEY